MENSSATKKPVHVADEGLTILADPVGAMSDVVLIHGLQGHPKKTWLYESTSFSRFKRKPGSCYWPEDLLPKDFPKIRIITYGYDSHTSHFFSGTANQTNILGHARAFIEEFEGLRQAVPRRPLVFVAHSLGGLLLKAILSQTSEAENSLSNQIVYDIFTSTVGTIFLGTPHRGSDYAQMGQIVALAAKTLQVDSTTSLLRDMKVDASVLELLNGSFIRLATRQNFTIVTFEEGRALGVPLLARDKVVPHWSAHLGLDDETEHKNVINADHRKMCRFEGAESAGYGKVKRAIERCLRDRDANILDFEFSQALRNLYTPETSLRYESIERRYSNTYEWIFTDESLGFKAWLESAEPFFWIKGKPASGKSTLMKMISNDKRVSSVLKRQDQKISIAAYFFHDRGSQLQKTLQGLMREILHTILSDIPELRSLFLKAYRRSSSYFLSGSKFEWGLRTTIPLYRDILQQNIVNASIILFIDALDEYSGNYADIVKFLRESNGINKTHLKICFSSRPEQLLLDSFIHLPGFYIHDRTKSDIREVIEATFRENPRIQRDTQSGSPLEKNKILHIQAEIARLAEGVFLWVRLIVDEILNEHTNGASIDELLDLLHSVPRELESYYDHIMANRINKKYAAEREAMFEILLSAVRRLTVKELFVTLQLIPVTDLKNFSVSLPSLEEARRRIKSRCGSLVELQFVNKSGRTDYDHPLDNFYVQFLHQTVKTWSGKNSQANGRFHNENGYSFLIKMIAHASQDTEDSESSSILLDDRRIDLGLLVELVRCAEATTGRSSCYILNQMNLSKVDWGDLEEAPDMSHISTIALLAASPLLLEEYLNSSSIPRMLFARYCNMLYKGYYLAQYHSRIASLLIRSIDAPREAQVWPSIFHLFDTKGLIESNSGYARVVEEVLIFALDEGVDPNSPFLKFRWSNKFNASDPRTIDSDEEHYILHEITRTLDSDADLKLRLGIKVCRTLLKGGADPNVLDDGGSTALDHALLIIRNSMMDLERLWITHDFCVALLDVGAKVSTGVSDQLRSEGIDRLKELGCNERLLNPPILTSPQPPQAAESGIINRVSNMLSGYGLWS